MLRIGLHLAWACILVAWLFPRWSALRQQQAIQQWSRQLLRILGIELRIQGHALAGGPVLRVCNHISWLDIYVLFAVGHCRFVSKADVRHWPVIGRLTEAVGTLYVERAHKRDAVRVVHQMAQQLASGDIVVVFPEGTTSDGSTVLPFHANLLQAAIASQSPIQPLALAYRNANTGCHSLAPVYIGQDSLLASIWRTSCAQRLCVRLTVGEVQSAYGRDRRTWSADLRAHIVALRTE